MEPVPPAAPSSGALGNLAGSEPLPRLVLGWTGLLPDSVELLETVRIWRKKFNGKTGPDRRVNEVLSNVS